MSAYESGLTYEQLQDAIASNAVSSIERAKGSLRNNRGMCQVVLSYQKADPSAATGKKQVRLTHQTDVPFRKNMSDKRKRDIIGEWKSLVLSDIDKASGASVDPTKPVRVLVEQFITRQEEIGTYTKVTKQGHGTKGISHTTASKRRADVARLDGFAVYDMPLISVTSGMLEVLVTDLCKRYTGSSIQATFVVLYQTFKWALGDKAANPCDGLELPSPDYRPNGNKNQRHKNILNKEAAKAFVAKCADAVGKRQEVVLLGGLLALTAGMRTEETCGLMWSDVHIDTDKPYIHIERSVVRYKSGDKWIREIGLTKTKDSVRDVPLYPETANVLRRVRESRIEALKGLDLNEKKSINDLYVLGDLEGNFRGTDTQSGCFSAYAKRTQLLGANGEPVTMHNLRDSFASRLVNEGVADTRVQKLLGHANVAMTQKRYISSSNDDIFEAIEETSGLFSVDEVEDQQEDATVYTLSPEEARLIEAYRAADEKGKRHLQRWADVELKMMNEEANERREKMRVI